MVKISAVALEAMMISNELLVLLHLLSPAGGGETLDFQTRVVTILQLHVPVQYILRRQKKKNKISIIMFEKPRMMQWTHL